VSGTTTTTRTDSINRNDQPVVRIKS